MTGNARGEDPGGTMSSAGSDASATIAWLSSRACPPVAYLTARELIRPTPPEAVVQRLRSEMLTWGPLSQVLSLQLDDGSFPFSQKTPTAQPTFLALRLLERCGMTVEDEPVSRAITYLTANHLGKGAVSYTSGASGILPCYLGVVARDVIRMGGRDSQLAQTSIRWLLDYQRYDHRNSRRGGVKTWPYKAVVHYRCWESVSCYHGVVAALQAFAALPTPARNSK